jgi:Holliday junction resolvase RusA-like endonuclease
MSWLRDALYLAQAQRPQKLTGRYKLSIQAVRKNARKRDIDNLIKPISDLLVRLGTVTDDSLCEMVSARWVTTGEGITVRIEQAGVE